MYLIFYQWPLLPIFSQKSEWLRHDFFWPKVCGLLGKTPYIYTRYQVWGVTRWNFDFWYCHKGYHPPLEERKTTDVPCVPPHSQQLVIWKDTFLFIPEKSRSIASSVNTKIILSTSIFGEKNHFSAWVVQKSQFLEEMTLTQCNFQNLTE